MTDQAPTKNTKKSKTKASARNKKEVVAEPKSKATIGKTSKKPRHLTGVTGREEQEQSTATSTRQQKKDKKGKKPNKKNTKDDEMATTPLSVTPGVTEVPTGTSTLSAISTTTTTTTTTTPTTSPLPPHLPAQTPPTGHKIPGGSTRKAKAPTPNPDAPVVPPPSTKHPVTPTGGSVEKWGAEPTAKAWMEKADFGKAKADFDRIQALPVNVDKECKKWKNNAKWNQSDEYPALDSNLVKVEGEYCNMSQVEVGLARPVLMGQLPVKDSEESFWKAVFEKRATMIHVLVGNESADFFPQKAEDYKNYGQMWINNRRVEVVNEDISRFLIEVLPHGCSNSIVCNVALIKNWNIDSVHAKQAVVIKETIELTTFMSTSSSDEHPLILSQHGAGRAGYFLALTAAVNRLEAKIEPCIADIVKTIRVQRPKAVETLTQYASLYISLFYFIKKKIANQAKAVEGEKKVDGDKKADGEKKVVASTNSTDPLIKKAVELTMIFTNALIAETQPSLMGNTSTTTGGSAVLSVTSAKM